MKTAFEYRVLVGLQTHENARKVLNKARGHYPTERQIWLCVASLDEMRGEKDVVDRLVQKVYSNGHCFNGVVNE
ncbi:hypothetical protein KIN20_024918 [Parelaphostrongylus tenuis]|uniref:Uncharacterized protein n=1 Tax=Parelaphostrongylus tenuis TaxID=148309 RepID=A0AAD5N8Q0_PARTN|nr:hypothetical protein KIN20_024918 [Parelaphostrongylus tenuis]